MRSLTNEETVAMHLFAEKLPIGEKAKFLRDLESCQVEQKTSDGSLLRFTLVGYERTDYKGQHQYGCEGQVWDLDGELITVCVYADHNDRLFELELNKWSDTPIREIQWSSFQVS